MKSDLEKEAGAIILKNYGHLFKKQYQDFLSISYDDSWNDNKTFLPIRTCMNPQELVSITELVTSDNTLMTKVLSAITALCTEIVVLKKEAFKRHFLFLSVYDEYSTTDISCQMESICALTGFVSRCEEVLKNLCTQVFSLYAENVINLNGIRLHYIIHHIGEIFTVIILVELLISNSALVSNWNKFCKTLKNFENNSNFGIPEENYAAVHSALNNIKTKIMNDDIVQNSLSSLSQLRNNLVDKNCSIIANEFAHYIKLAILNLDKLVQDKPNTHNMYRCIKVNALFVLNVHLFGTNDKKNFKNLVELNIKAHSIYVAGTTIWFSEVFLQRFVPSLCESYGKLSHSMLKARQNYLVTKKASLIRDVVNIQTLCTQWALHLEDMYSGRYHEISASEMSLHTKTLLDGLDIASTISHSLLTYVNIHLALGVPLSKTILMVIFETIDALKSLNNAINRNRHNINNSVNMIVQHLLFQATCFIVEIKKTLMTDKNYANKRLDELTCTVIAERTLKGAATTERNIAANVALSFIPDTTYIEDVYAKMGAILEKILTLSSFLKSMHAFCNCSWMLWHQNILPIYFSQNYSMQLNAYKIKYFLMVLEDCLVTLYQTDKYYEGSKSQDFLKTISTIVNESIIKSFSQNIETNIRLHIHSHLQVDTVNPFSTDMTKKVLLVIDNFRINCVYMAVIPNVEHYLSTMYYNLTTVVLSDWKTYGEMRQMAKWKFNLKTVEDNLPTQTLEQGLDVLEIMRNIHIFVAKYLYNLNNQIFIEKSSNNKHLNSINIQHIANSIRTHGTGIMNTTVNFTYQFLKKKFFTFSQFMYDEHIKSRLIKDLRTFKEMTDTGSHMYPYKNAERFNKGIKSLGIGDDGQSYLDLFRDLISQIGNAMGYVRMIRSGGRHCCSDATVFLPSLEINKSFKDLCIEADLNSRCIDSSENLDSSINNLTTNFLQGTEYFKLLVDAFAPVFRNPKNVHLKNFYVIVPPLTLNFVEHMILSKDKMTKKNKVGAAFTDDGFAMGVAYILKLLDQNNQLDSLHWFESVWQHIQDERQLLQEQKLKGSLQLQQALALTEKKIKTLEEEYSLLYYSLTSARIFFR